MNYNIALLKGDGIGPEIVDEAVKVLDKVGEKFGHKFKYVQGYLGGESIDKYGIPLSDETVQVCRESDAILLGAIGGPKWDNIDPQKRPERGLLAIRKELGVYTNLRPATLFKPLKSSSPLKEEIIGEGLDIMIVRELTGGLYFGHREYSEEKAYDTLSYTRPEIERIAKKAFEIAKDYPEVEVSHMYVDNAAMQLISNPGQFDVILTENMFGDILSDEASMLTGSLGMLASASLGDGKKGLYEPSHGSAPDIAGQNVANPIATILSAAMMLRYSFDLSAEADAIEKAVEKTLEEGYRTADIYTEGMKKVGTAEMGTEIVGRI